MTVTAPTLVEASDIVLGYNGRVVLEGVDITVAEKEIVTLIGPNGSGKTSLARVMLGLVEPESGSIWRRSGLSIGYLPQRLNIDANLPLSVERFLRLADRRSSSQIDDVLAEVGAQHRAGSMVSSLSGGELQRVLLARALLRAPDLLVLDEPTQGVDFSGQIEFYGLISRIRDRHGCGVLTISHDLHLVMAATDRVVCLNHHICCSGEPESVRRHPEYLALFGPDAAERLAVYAHHHDHSHDLAGEIVEPHHHEHS